MMRVLQHEHSTATFAKLGGYDGSKSNSCGKQTVGGSEVTFTAPPKCAYPQGLEQDMYLYLTFTTTNN